MKRLLAVALACLCLTGCKYDYENDDHEDTVPAVFRKPITDEELKKDHEEGSLIAIIDEFYVTLISEHKAKFKDYIDGIEYESYDTLGYEGIDSDYYYVKLKDKSDSYLKSTINTLRTRKPFYAVEPNWIESIC